jgi:hypothetical protein
MSDAANWQGSNARYLAEAISWLRLRLECHSSRTTATTFGLPPVMLKREPRSFWQRLFKGTSVEPPSSGPILLPSNAPSKTLPASAQEARQAANLFSTQPGSQMQPALLLLGQRLGLSRFEVQTLLLGVAMELDTSIAGLCARAQDDPGRPFPTFALALSLFDQPAWDALSPERPLRYWRLIEINQPGAQPLTSSPFRADERIVNYVKGLNYLDDRLAHLLSPLDAAEGVELPGSQSVLVETIVGRLKQATTAQSLPIIQLLGGDGSSKQLVASQVGHALGMRMYQISAESIPVNSAELETFGRLWHRECLLLPIALYLEAYELDAGATSESHSAAIHRFLSRAEGIVILDGRDVWPVSGRPTLPLDVAKPSPAEQRAAWESSLGANSTEKSARFAGQFNLSLSSIHEITRAALLEAPDDLGGLEERIWSACLARTRPRMDMLAERLEPCATWADIVLPETEVQLLRQIAAQVGQRSTVYDNWGFRQKMNRGLGITALFAGDSGTGKTMAAEVIANDLKLNLYRIDLSAVVSKYIGETEKNLRRLFDAAENGGGILFFDEADALFGKRSEVKDSHDRYANIEINYLLQRMETYRGLAILASNMKSSLDTAFMRRLRFIVNFAFPGPLERKAIWQKVFPPQVPVDSLDYDRLARLNLTGGSIRNIAVNAAFMAAQAKTALNMTLVLNAARTECRKLDLPINEADFRVKPAMAATA